MRCLALISSVILFLAISSPAPCAEQMILVPAGTFIMGDGTSTCGVMEHEGGCVFCHSCGYSKC